MTERENGGSHIDLDALADFAAGGLDTPGAAAVKRHVERCVTCRLELRRLERFASIDRDDDLAAEAGWPSAEAELERTFEERILTGALSPVPHPRRSIGMRLRRPGFWLVPVAAVAVFLVVFNYAREGTQDLPEGPAPIRGEKAAARALVPVAPTGLLEETPRQFSWKASRTFDSLSVEILTPALERLFVQSGITDTTWAVPDTLRAVLVPGRTYLWRVQGHHGLSAPQTSIHAWFRLPAPSKGK